MSFDRKIRYKYYFCQRNISSQLFRNVFINELQKCVDKKKSMEISIYGIIITLTSFWKFNSTHLRSFLERPRSEDCWYVRQCFMGGVHFVSWDVPVSLAECMNKLSGYNTNTISLKKKPTTRVFWSVSSSIVTPFGNTAIIRR